MQTYGAAAIVLIATLYTQVYTQDYIQDDTTIEDLDNNNADSLWLKRSLRLSSSELDSSSSSSNENYQYYNSYEAEINRPNRQRLVKSRYVTQKNQQSATIPKNREVKDESSDLADYDIDEDEIEDDEDNNRDLSRYRGGHKGGKGKKRGQEEEEDPFKKYVPPFWLGKPKFGWGNSHVEQVGWIINNDAPGGWKVSYGGTGESIAGLHYIEGKGWTGQVGAPWRKEMPHQWGPGWGHIMEDDEGGKKGKKGHKGHKGGKGGKNKGKGGKKKKKKRGNQCDSGGGKKRRGKGKGKKHRSGRGDHGGGGKGGKKRGGGGRGGWGQDECDKGPKPWFGWPQKIKFIPPPPRGSQIWLKPYPPKNLKTGWSDYHGWDWINKIPGGWGVSDLVGVVHL